MNIFDTEPNFVNEEGTKWWIDRDATRWATREDRFGTSLPNVVCWVLETKTGYRTYLLVDSETQQALYESQQLEAIAQRIDVLKLMERDKQKENTDGTHAQGSNGDR